MKLKKGIPVIDQCNKHGFWGLFNFLPLRFIGVGMPSRTQFLCSKFDASEFGHARTANVGIPHTDIDVATGFRGSEP